MPYDGCVQADQQATVSAREVASDGASSDVRV
jgi:hypothetical protein